MAEAPFAEGYERFKALDAGGGATVFEATRSVDGERVAVKFAHDDDVALRRLRREIEVLRQYAAPNVVPVLDADDSIPPRWYVMPLAEGSLHSLRPELEIDDLDTVLRAIAAGLRAPHAALEVHRDLNPRNVLALRDGDRGRRWVVADWGFVKRGPTVETTTVTTYGGGTRGFIAPECQTDAHGALPAADIYGMGRIAAWFVTGVWPQEGLQLLPGAAYADWRSLIRRATETRVAARCPDLESFLALLDQVADTSAPPPDLEASELVDRLAQIDDPVSATRLLGLALDNDDDYDLYIDKIARLPATAIMVMADVDPDGLAKIAMRLAALFASGDFGHRNFNYANIPLRFLRRSADALFRSDRRGDAEDLLEEFFELAVAWDRFDEQRDTPRWFESVKAGDAEVVGRVLRRVPGAAERYARTPSMAGPIKHALRR